MQEQDTEQSKKLRQVLLLVNTGSPQSNSLQEVKRFIGELLMDKRVIRLPYLIRLFLVRGIILPIRAKKSWRRYQAIWDASTNSMPLYKHSQEICKQLKMRSFESVSAMRYSKPSCREVLKSIENPGEKSLCIFPLFPQHTASSYQTAYEEAISAARKIGFGSIKTVAPFYKHPAYVQALATSIASYLKEPFDKLIFSFHSIPLSHQQLDKELSPKQEENYMQQCEQTCRLTCKELGLDTKHVEVLFQSQMKGSAWQGPFLSDRLKELPQEGCKRILICCPTFICDCLESVVEVAEEGKALFLEQGGEELRYIPCLNSHPAWIAAITTLAKTAV